MRYFFVLTLTFIFTVNAFSQFMESQMLKINESGYYEAPAVNIMVFDDFYPEGHQGGITLVQCNRRLAANGDIWLEPAPGQWSPVPKVGARTVNREQGTINVELWYPDTSKNRKGFNPIVYPDIAFHYRIKTEAIGKSIKLTVELDKPLSKEWEGKVGFNLEIFPGDYFGEHYLIDNVTGIFPQQFISPTKIEKDGSLDVLPMSTGKHLTVAPGKAEKEFSITSLGKELQLIDGRAFQQNGWFIVRSLVKSENPVIEWIIIPAIQTDWMYKPVIQVSQVGFHPAQKKFAVIELDSKTEKLFPIELIRVLPSATIKVIKVVQAPALWGKFLRFKYLKFDFSDVCEEGLYFIRYDKSESNRFEIKKSIFAENVWQPTVAYFLPIQMCHMRVEDRYKVWHGLCHMDDALMAPINHNHFDGYIQGNSTLTSFKSGEHVPGLNIGGWHDAGDYDLRIESQAETVYKLALAYEYFPNDYDAVTINQSTRLVQLNVPDGKPDILQQIEHGVLSIVGSYESLGRLYRGIICPTLKAYVHLGDAATMSDNLIYKEGAGDPVLHQPLPKDDRWVFTEENPRHELYSAQALAACSRVLKNYDKSLSERCIKIAEEIFNNTKNVNDDEKINAAAELYFTTSDSKYENFLRANIPSIIKNVIHYSEVVGRLTKRLNDENLSKQMENAVRRFSVQIEEQQKENPYGVPYKPHIWGAGWGIQSLAVKQLLLALEFPKIISPEYALNALNFILGCHPGENTSSFVSGVGVQSLTVAYGTNRDEWSYIPGGIASGTSLIRPDLPELKVWPYFWQQTEYVLGGGTSDFIFLAFAADSLLNNKRKN